MSVIGGIIAGIAGKVGAELVGKVLGDRFGPAGGQLAETVVKEVADRVGLPVDRLPEATESELESAVRDVETAMPEIIGLWAKGLDGQFTLLQAETKEGPLQSGWRWGWMYLLAFFWIWRTLFAPYLNAWIENGGGIAPELIDYAILMTLTSWFISLYMGGHTIKEFGKSIASAIGSWKGRPK
ncbi:hypothetical protein JF546_09745 [Nitratireductor aquimarinus]|uniref:hypothetical protein n=1 Tax=Nitratireductor aquimarinus TaxID=889300 RepID=UPI001A8FBAB6|nr:hypothetical protein [Nitratireductor aquimarinus]MBN8243292.1 hypothetical protein [Nitratireductor aquimarinus]MBY6131193.1 hypothetical protein [Nitratireductor aquimarinus]MCA1302051.1 hypothetical protein [Nitratireductor aquimarinus]